MEKGVKTDLEKNNFVKHLTLTSTCTLYVHVTQGIRGSYEQSGAQGLKQT
jgi:hypothetical protein